VVSFEGMVGARAIWQMERVRQLVSVRYEPGTIGLSAIAGYLGLQPPASELGLALMLGPGGRQVIAPVAPGVVEQIGVRACHWLEDGARVRIEHTPCVLALDGERDFVVRNGMLIDVQLDRNGPHVVQVQRALELGVEHGLFDPAGLDLSAGRDRAGI
jgi:hypothetical protein